MKKNSTPIMHQSEDIWSTLTRVRVEGGWLYVYQPGGLAFVPDAPVATPEQLPRSGLTQKQIRARRKNVEKARDSLAKAKSDRME